MRTTDTIYISVSDLNYGGQTTAQAISRAAWWKRTQWDGRNLVQRISATAYDRIKYREFSRSYDKAIQAKYNVAPGWQQNRYFVEQVRPTL